MTKIPSYRHYKPKDLAVVRLDGRDIYLGKYDSPESREKYGRIIAEWSATGAVPSPRKAPTPTGPTINELILRHDAHVIEYYQKNGRPTSEADNIRRSLRTLREIYGTTPAAEFGPLKLKAVRQKYLDLGVARSEVNRRTSHVVRFFRWCAENELVPPELHHGLKTVRSLTKGRSTARETKPVRPVDDARVDAIKPFVSRQVWAMIELQRLTGMRPGEACIIRTMDIDRSREPWTYVPGSHKTEHHDQERQIAIGPRARAVLTPWLRTNPDEYLFSPREAEQERLKGMRERRKTPVQPSQRDRHKPGRNRRLQTLGNYYDEKRYYVAISRGCVKAFPHPTISRMKIKDRTPAQVAELKEWNRKHRWFPNQIRHTAGTKIRARFDLETSKAVLGHTTSKTTEIYAERDRSVAEDAIEAIG